MAETVNNAWECFDNWVLKFLRVGEVGVSELDGGLAADDQGLEEDLQVG
jgi:hypothetical protein